MAIVVKVNNKVINNLKTYNTSSVIPLRSKTWEDPVYDPTTGDLTITQAYRVVQSESDIAIDVEA